MKRLDEAELSDEIRAELGELVSRILLECDPELVVLFGSWARGEAGKRSDFDVVVVADVPDTHTLAGRLMRVLRRDDREVDVLVVSRERWEHGKLLPGLVLYRAEREGVVLHGRAA